MDWQILNSIQTQSSCSRHELLTLMQPFANKAEVEGCLTRFTSAGLLTSQDEQTLTLTPSGLVLHVACLTAQQAFRKTALAGITPDAYETTVATLRQLVENVTSVEM